MEAAGVTDDGLKLRPMTFEGIRYDDDYHVMWRDLSVGRILKQSGVAWGQPDWYWGINFGQRPQGGDARGAISTTARPSQGGVGTRPAGPL